MSGLFCISQCCQSSIDLLLDDDLYFTLSHRNNAAVQCLAFNSLVVCNRLRCTVAFGADAISGDAVVVGTIVNNGTTEDKLLGIAVGTNQAVLTGETVLKQNAPIRFEGDSANAKAVFLGVSPVAGRHVKISLGFARAGFVTAEVIIRDQRDTYKNVTSGAATPAATSSPDSQPLQ